MLPILSNKCFVCHGPDAQDEDRVRLDSFAAATRDLGGYRAIDPDDPDNSEILVRIHSTDDPMPPQDAEKQLSVAERDLISRWVRQGGKYAQHWAFVPPKKQRPHDSDAATPGEMIDAFVRARLQAKGIDFAPEADRATLARRVALVLTGLPPEPSQLAAFLSDNRAGGLRAFGRRAAGQSRVTVSIRPATGWTRCAMATRTACTWTTAAASIPIATGSCMP